MDTASTRATIGRTEDGTAAKSMAANNETCSSLGPMMPPAAQPTGWVEVTKKLIDGQSVIGRLPERDLLTLMQRSQIRSLGGRERIYRQGDPGRTVIAVLDGYVKLSSMTGVGREVVLEVVRPGMCFGELDVFNDWTRDADATTLSRCRLLAIDGRQFTQVMRQSPAGLRGMVELASQRLRKATERVLDAAALPAPARVAKTLLWLAELQCAALPDGLRIELQLSQAELGGMTGLTRESTNKHLATLRDAGWIALTGGLVTLLDVGALARLLRDHDALRSEVPVRRRQPGRERKAA